MTLVCQSDIRVRLDIGLLAAVQQQGGLAGLSRSQVKQWIDRGLVTVNGVPAHKSGLWIERGDRIEVAAGAIEDSPWARLEARAAPLAIVYQDASLLVVDKPAGLSVHPGAGNRQSTLVNALLALPEISAAIRRQSRSDRMRPGIVHRLDKDTSGLLVVALQAQARLKLAAQFSRHSIERVYYALVYSTPRGRRLIDRSDSGTIETWIGRDARDRRRMAVVKSPGRRAVTHWRVIQRMPYAVLLELQLETGRTHQIRVHMAHCGCPLIGDKTYGMHQDLPAVLERAAKELGRQALHAARLGFSHPENGRFVSFQSAIPCDMQEAISAFGGSLAGI